MVTYKRFLLTSSLISFLFILYTLLKGNFDASFNLFPLIPLIYGSLYFILVPNNSYWGPGFCIINIILFLRFILYPFLLAYDDFVLTKFAYFEFIYPAIILQLLEIITILLVIKKFINRNHFLVNKMVSVEKLEFPNLRKIQVFLFISIIVFIILFALAPNSYANRHFILQTSYIIEEKIFIENSSIAVILKFLEIFILLLIFSLAYVKRKPFFICALILFLPCLFYEGNSRLSLVTPMLATIFLLIRFFPNKKKFILYSGTTYLLMSILILTMVKTFKVEENMTISTNNMSGLFNSYFCGIENTAIAIKEYFLYKDYIGIQTFINDMFRNTLHFSKYFSSANNSIQYFNNTFYGYNVDYVDQIPPTVGQSICYFGILGFWILSFIMTRVVLWADKKFLTSKIIEDIWIYVMMGLTVGWALPASFQHLYMFIHYKYIPLSILFILYHKIK